MQPVPRRLTLALAVASLILLAIAGSAAAFSVASVTATPRAPVSGEPGFGLAQLLPSDPFASGAHPVMDITTTFDPSDGRGGATTARQIVQHLGAGIVANPHATAACTQADFNAASPAPAGCAANTQVGTATATVIVNARPLVTRTLSGVIYNVAPNAGQPAALGIAFDLTPLGRAGLFLKDFAAVTVDPTDLGLLTTLDNLNPTLPVVATRLTLWGYAATGGNPPLVPYFTNPASCTPATVSVSATAYDGETGTNSGSYTPTACDTAPFDTSLTVSANPSSTDSLSAISVHVKPAPIFVPRVNSYVKQNSVTLPPGTLLNPALAASLDACTDEQFARSDPSRAPTCPPSSNVGTVSFVSPILGPFPGTAYFGTATSTDTLRLFLDVPLFGAHIKVIGGVRPNYTTGQVTTVFDDLPQVAFTDFLVNFNGAPLSVFTTPSTCGTNTAFAINQPYSGGAASVPTGSFTTSYDGNGAPCVTKFGPYFNGSPSNLRSGASTNFTLKFTRPDRNVPLSRVTFKLPRGLIGNLALRGLVQCSLADAGNGACGSASKAGTAQVSVGSGPAPATLPGTVYLTAPKVAGDPAALSVLVPARLGPVDVGNVIVGVRLQLRSNGGLTAISDTLPQFQKGITTAVRVATITIDRSGFMRNPTACGHRRYPGTFDPLAGQGANPVTTYAAFDLTDCKSLGFSPKFAIKVGARGKTGAGAHPPLTTTITQPNGQAGISWVHVLLPRALPSNSVGLNQACSQSAFDAGSCGNRAKIATAKATSPFVTRSLSGPVYLVKQDRRLPKLVVQLRGPLSIDLTGQIKIGSGNKIATTFGTVPDLPVTKFSLSFHSGRYGIVGANTNLCRGRLFAPTEFHGQNGKKSKQRPQITVNGCAKKGR
jgi:hypothetical protein